MRWLAWKPSLPAIGSGISRTHAYVADLEEELEICRSADAAAPNRTREGRLSRPRKAS
jgi:hypothetical protein